MVKGKPTPKRRDRERARARNCVHDDARINLAHMREARGERARQRQWNLDKTVSNPPEHYDAVIDDPDNATPITRTERRYLKHEGIE